MPFEAINSDHSNFISSAESVASAEKEMAFKSSITTGISNVTEKRETKIATRMRDLSIRKGRTIHKS